MSGIVADVGSGLAAAVAICVAEQERIVEEAEQERDLFGETPAAERGPGRPPGAPNRITEQQAALIRASGKSPLAFLAEVWRNESFGRDDRIKAAVAALPYVHKRQPIAVDLTNHQRITLVIGDVASDLPDGTDAGDFSMTISGSGEEIKNGANPPLIASNSNGSHSNDPLESGTEQPKTSVTASASRAGGEP